MRVQDFLRSEKDLGRTDLIVIIASALDVTPEAIYTHPEKELDDTALERIARHIDERKKGRPLSYITNTKEFFSQDFYVDERVLIPRPETELLVEEALHAMVAARSPLNQESGHATVAKKEDVRILDMGTGSGAIGITLARYGASSVACVDVSFDALLVARWNAKRLAVEDRISLVQSDLFGGLKKKARFDIIVANLPYISASDCERLMPDVKREPPRALLGGTRGTEVYERFVADLPHHLEESGSVICELGDAGQIESVGKSMRALGLRVRSKKDLAGQDRVLIGSWKNLS